MRRFIASISAMSLMLASAFASAEVRITSERIDNASAGLEFAFKNVPAPLKNDLAAGKRFTIIDGQSDPNGSNIRKLNDGRLPQEEDDPGENFFFVQGSKGGRLALDLGAIIEVTQVNSYSWHTDSRAPQVYKLFAADGTAAEWNATPKRGTDPLSCGWKLLASVDTRPKTGQPGGQYGVSIADSDGALGKFRYFLFDISPTEERDPFGNTFYSEIDVRAVAPADPEVAAVTQAAPRAKDFEYTLDYSQSPQLKEWAETKLRPQIDKWYPIFCDCLASDGFSAPKKFSIIIKPTGGVAATGGTEVTVSTAWIERQLARGQWNEAIGSVIHELVHVVQQYKTRGNPCWMVEGIADYYRWFHYEPAEHRPRLRNQRAKFSDSYQTTAGFLEYVVKNHDHELVIKMNAAMRQGRYNAALWKDFTGMSVQELWAEYVKSVFPVEGAAQGK